MEQGATGKGHRSIDHLDASLVRRPVPRYASGDCFRSPAPGHSWLPAVATSVPSTRSRSCERAVMPSLGKLR